ncbi:type III pantothenate kinase [candidate division KSB1 bacterium]|nr:type III pantothenate kinase [candidate division KSB1 bacterium]
MLLTIDVGNTNIVIGVYDKDELKKHWRLSSTVTRTSDECWILLTTLLQNSSNMIEKIDGVIIASVVPNITPAFVRTIQDNLKIAPIVVDSNLDIGLINLYQDPSAVGADRLVNAVAGYTMYGGPCIIVDFGTATTFDVVTENYEYLGGVIAPGIETSANVLHRIAARLPKVEMKFPPSFIGRTTETSMQSGLMFGAVELVDGMIHRIEEELGSHAHKVATGGLANLIIPYSKTISRIEPMLTLIGLRLIYEKVTAAS